MVQQTQELARQTWQPELHFLDSQKEGANSCKLSPNTGVVAPSPNEEKLLFSFVYFKMILNSRKKMIQNSLSIPK